MLGSTGRLTLLQHFLKNWGTGNVLIPLKQNKIKRIIWIYVNCHIKVKVKVQVFFYSYAKDFAGRRICIQDEQQ